MKLQVTVLGTKAGGQRGLDVKNTTNTEDFINNFLRLNDYGDKACPFGVRFKQRDFTDQSHSINLNQSQSISINLNQSQSISINQACSITLLLLCCMTIV